MQNKLFTLPNIVTLCNLACGCAAVVFALSGRPECCFWLVAAGAGFDFADGLVARLTGQYSDVGRELDSLADMVTFGAAPGAALFALYGTSQGGTLTPDPLGWAAFAVTLFAALRLAKFNVDETQHDEFTGLPTPAAALAVTALAWIWSGEAAVSREIVLLVAGVVSALSICPLRMFSLKFKGFALRENLLRYTFLVACAVLIAAFGIGGVAASVGVYIAISAARRIARMRG